MERIVSATDARVRFGELIRRVTEDGEAVIVARSGVPQIVIVSITEYRQLKTAKAATVSWQAQVEAVRSRIAAELGDRSLPPSEQVIRQMREERDAQFLDLH